MKKQVIIVLFTILCIVQISASDVTTPNTFTVGTGTITSKHLATNSVYAAETAAGAVGSREISDGSVNYNSQNMTAMYFPTRY